MALSQDTPRATGFLSDVVASFPVAASTTIYEGEVVQVDSGYAKASGGGASEVFVGIALEQVDNSDGSAGDKYVKVLPFGLIKVTVSGSSIASPGASVYYDGSAFTQTSGTLPVGTVFQWVTGTTCLVAVKGNELGI